MSTPARKFTAIGEGEAALTGGDRPRADVKRRQWGRVTLGALGIAILAAATWGFRALEQQPPSVERSSLWIGAVKRGEFVKDVRATGTLVPKEVRWVPAPGEGRVEKILVKPGETVTPETVLMELSNPQLEKERLDAEWAVNAAEAELKNSEAELQGQVLAQETVLSNVRSELDVARLASDRDAKLHAAGLLAEFEVKVSAAKEKELGTRAALAEKSLASVRAGMDARLATQRARLEQARALLDLRNREFGALKVTAGAAGTVQQVPVEAGQQVSTGATLARVAQQGELKCELRVQESQVSEVAPGQPVRVDLRTGIALGRVSRIEPSVEAGAVLVEVLFEGELPKGARPDLSVDGTIELQRIPDTLHVERPVNVNANATLPIFRITPEGTAVKGPVQFGAASSTQIQVVQGLNAGDEVILGDTKQWDLVETLRLR